MSDSDNTNKSNIDFKAEFPQAKKRIDALFEFVDNSPTAFHASLNEAKELEKHGFTELKWEDEWKFNPGDKYYLIIGGTTFISFIVGTEKAKGFKIIGTHNDSPTLCIKNNPEMKSEGLKQLNVEPYGGLVYRGWFDRPLSVAGRVLLRGENNSIKTEIINVEKDLMIIPSLAIHMDRAMNEGYKISPQKELKPVYAMDSDESQDFIDYIAEYLGVETAEILDYDLSLYPRENGTYIGINSEFYSLGRLDNLLMTHQALTAIAESTDTNISFHRIFVSFDNEEIGSQTGRGADSALFGNFLKRLNIACGGSEEDYYRSLANSFIISTDVSHAAHPNYPEMADPTNRPRLNGGPVLKIAARKSYNTTGESAARFRLYAENANAPVQCFYNHSDKRGGSTISPLAEAQTAIPGADIGIPILSMHNIREMGGVLDHEFSIRIMKEFFASEY